MSAEQKPQWIIDAQQDGLAEAERIQALRLQAEADKARFDSESVTPLDLEKHIARFEAPVADVVRDLEKARGFIIERSSPGLLYDSETDKRRISPNRYSLTNKQNVLAGLTNYDVEQHHVFGKEWVIRQDGSRDVLGVVRIYPTVAPRTHFGGVDYVVWDSYVRNEGFNGKKRQVAHADMLAFEESEEARFAEAERVTEFLQTALGTMIRQGQIKRGILPTQSSRTS